MCAQTPQAQVAPMVQHVHLIAVLRLRSIPRAQHMCQRCKLRSLRQRHDQSPTPAAEMPQNSQTRKEGQIPKPDGASSCIQSGLHSWSLLFFQLEIIEAMLPHASVQRRTLKNPMLVCGLRCLCQQTYLASAGRRSSSLLS